MMRGSRRHLSDLLKQIYRVIPLIPGNYNRKVVGRAREAVAELERLAREENVQPASFAKNWQLQLGSLGGGNHFIEVVADEAGQVWTFLHSGSRGVGNQIARRFISAAQRATERRGDRKS